MNPSSLSALSSTALTQTIAELRGRQRTDDVQFLLLLAEIDRRKTYAELAYDSLWDYCTRELRLTNGAAGRRISAARLLARFPAAAPFLADGRLGLTTFGMLKDLLTEENHVSMFEAAALKSEREVDALVRIHNPLTFVRDTVVRTVAAPQFTPAPGVTTVQVAEPAPATVPQPLPPARVRAVDAEYVSLTLRVPKEFMADLEQVTAALSHIVPNGKPAEVLRECIQRTLEQHAKRRHGLPARRADARTDDAPRTPAPGVDLRAEPFTPAPGVEAEENTRTIPADVAREVWERDEGCCTFVGSNGRRCRSTHQLELHHRVAFALGGRATATNLTLHCRAHNVLQAQRELGEDLMRRVSRPARALTA